MKISAGVPLTKTIFITGGVVSGIGKGIAVASLGTLLRHKGISVIPVKADPYLNQDAGTMNPFQHGEVFVTDDGAETDLDLGHYERFMDIPLSKLSNFTTGAVYQTVMEQERAGDYLGKTIQVIPHVTNEIKRRIAAPAEKFKPDVLIAEIGGTVGDIEALPYLEAIRQYAHEVGRERAMFIHVVKMDYIYPSDEGKTKPIQQSVNMLRGYGIQPDMLIVRCKRPLTESERDKIALFAGMEVGLVIEALDAASIYEVPLNLEREHVSAKILKRLKLKKHQDTLKDWRDLVRSIKNLKKTITIGMVGKYLDHPDAYLSVLEALRHAGYSEGYKIKIVPIDAEGKKMVKQLAEVDGMLVPGGFGIRGIEGKVAAIKYAREQNLPFLGLCLGLQCAVIEYARNVLGLTGANSTEFDPKTAYPVVDFLAGKRALTKMGGTLRLGAQRTLIVPGSQAAALFGNLRLVSERHRHRYEVNPVYYPRLEKAGLKLSAMSPAKTLVEMIELASHPFFLATQSHPEFLSRPNRPHPLFAGFIKAATFHNLKK